MSPSILDLKLSIETVTLTSSPGLNSALSVLTERVTSGFESSEFALTNEIPRLLHNPTIRTSDKNNANIFFLNILLDIIFLLSYILLKILFAPI